MIDNNLNLVSKLKEFNIKPSIQRIEILEYLMDNRIHPNIEGIYSALVDKMPTLSKATVYNTLDLFAKKGLANKLYIEPNEVRFDIRTDVHGHFKCEKCKKIEDVEIYNLDTEISKNGYKGIIYAEEINYRGICEDCAK
ncbi:MAG: Fur family transcriptional regulator [Firmicutes bacterium]|nr:Fur family transcriptional regulator [Bacillota bacterium]